MKDIIMEPFITVFFWIVIFLFSAALTKICKWVMKKAREKFTRWYVWKGYPWIACYMECLNTRIREGLKR